MDPIGSPIISTASARTGSTHNYALQMGKLSPNDTADFFGELNRLCLEVLHYKCYHDVCVI